MYKCVTACTQPQNVAYCVPTYLFYLRHQGRPYQGVDLYTINIYKIIISYILPYLTSPSFLDF